MKQAAYTLFAIRILSLAVVVQPVFADEALAFNGLSSESIKIDPEQGGVCNFFREMAYAIQHERRMNELEAFPASDSETMNEIAKWVYETFTIQVTPDEVGSGMNSDCVGMYQYANKSRLKVQRLQKDSAQKFEL